MTDSLERALKIIIEVANPDKVILFGSRARGDNTEDSDYDILVLIKGVINSREIVQKIYRNFRNIRAPVDVLVYDSDKYLEMIDYPYRIYYTINLEGKVIYEKAG